MVGYAPTFTCGTDTYSVRAFNTTGSSYEIPLGNYVEVQVQCNDMDTIGTTMPVNATTLQRMGVDVNADSATVTNIQWDYATGGGTYTIRLNNMVVYPQFMYTAADYVIRSILTPKEKLKLLLAERAAPHIITHAKPLGLTKDQREIRARETLCRVLGIQKFHDFLRKGFISIIAKSGLIYQIFPGHGISKVYNCGKLVERLCVVLNGDFPPTDSLIMRYLLILNNESSFRSYAVKHDIYEDNILQIKPDNRTLVEIFKDLKKAAAA
jgi:hypothetical protein